MNKDSISNISLTNWQRVDGLTDEQIDTSDIPLLDEIYPLTDDSA